MYIRYLIMQTASLPGFAREIVPCALPWGADSEAFWQAVVVLHAIKPRVSGAVRSRPSALWASKARLERQTRNRDGGRRGPARRRCEAPKEK